MARRSRNVSKSVEKALPLGELAGLRPEFAEVEKVWAGELAPKLSLREAARKKAISRAFSRTALGVVLAIVPFAGLLILSFGTLGFLFPIAFLVGILIVAAVSGFAWLKVYTLKSQTKDLVLSAACAPFGFTYQTLHPDVSNITDFASLKAHGKKLSEALSGAQAGDAKAIQTIFGEVRVSSGDTSAMPPPTPAFDILKDAALLPSHDRRKFEDLIEGERAGAKFSLVEARLDTSGDDSTTVFQGLLLHIEFPERFLGRTLMARSGWWKRGKGAGDLQKVDLISRELEKAFTVYSSDQVEARAILSPDRMERLIALERHFSGGKLRGVFDSGHMTIALEAPDQFEAGSVFEPLVDPRRFSSALSELGLVCDLIDGFLTRDWVRGRL
ncbi:MAG: DUF3137 domain-containing protein [Hyphomonas sp.]|nr:DUF3137 domain-containing protein [Hyphomonas sp.]